MTALMGWLRVKYPKIQVGKCLSCGHGRHGSVCVEYGFRNDICMCEEFVPRKTSVKMNDRRRA